VTERWGLFASCIEDAQEKGQAEVPWPSSYCLRDVQGFNTYALYEQIWQQAKGHY